LEGRFCGFRSLAQKPPQTLTRHGIRLYTLGMSDSLVVSEPLVLTPSSLKFAFAYISKFHAHHKPPQGGLFAVAISSGGTVRGVAVAGRPVARNDADGSSIEITRVAVERGVPEGRHGCSKLYGALWRAARALGDTRGITFTLPEESGASLRAAGWIAVRTTSGGSWSRAGRERVDKAPIGPKIRWEIRAQAE